MPEENASRPFGRYRPPRERRRWPPAFTPGTRRRILIMLAEAHDVDAIAKDLDIAAQPIRAIVAQLAMEELGEPVDPGEPVEPGDTSTTSTSTTTPEPEPSVIDRTLTTTAAAFLGIR